MIADFEVGALTNGGITIDNLNGGTFSNLILRNSHWGIQANFSTNIVIEDSHFDNINWWGIYMNYSTNNEFRNNEINDTFYGILLYANSHDNVIRDNYIHNNSFGIVVQNSNGAEIIGNRSFDNTRNSELGDVYVWRSSSNVFVDQLNAGISGESDLTVSYQADDIEFQAVGAPGTPHPELASLSKYFEVSIKNSSGALGIDIHYDESDYSELDLETLGLWHFDPDSGDEAWTAVADASVTGTEINATLSEDGVYGVFSGKAVVSTEPEEQPAAFELKQNYPNPFNPTTTIEYVLPEAADVRLHVYNLLGRRVATLVREHQTAGVHQTVFDASGLASGVYFYLIEAGSYRQNRQMLLVK